ncbi:MULTISPECIES: TetR/AcrR family transcriptional regulator [Streptomyces]|uniref:TetR/AcrR family transcriptional regulator n=1 Tax=Streptomyces TaxID=1883 RepID=UPI0002F73B03|nr:MULTISPECIES: TetR/AcrR family transcriptional regulator [Streptomyces]MCX4486382.1 TetR/AcrR family transcriptional regulator [Streptomyces anulatus]MCX4523358.1 TetR/AcrR family transcriptional regulator [Streptomyces anulatus]MCX4606368.1 TetR/AcrR family transcriptional regulator [Streptomyces anulatus]WSI82462.1 TetR/AcrR family transcriptional regulator [Streptomyces anulatus]WTD14787.1 TetR/AcrR family transcriptional regulator [Streptomyces anulatus]
MARPRTFDESAVLDAAAREFRVHGFAETSTEQLCEAAGVRRSSLYNAFTSKDELFVRALQHYVATTGARQSMILADDELTGAERLRTLVDVVVDEELQAANRGHAAGCMVVQSLMNPDLRERDERVARILDRDLRARLSLLSGAIRAGQVDGSIVEGIDPDDGAVLTSTVISGLRVTAQTGVDVETLRRIALTGLSSLLH